MHHLIHNVCRLTGRDKYLQMFNCPSIWRTKDHSNHTRHFKSGSYSLVSQRNQGFNVMGQDDSIFAGRPRENFLIGKSFQPDVLCKDYIEVWDFAKYAFNEMATEVFVGKKAQQDYDFFASISAFTFL